MHLVDNAKNERAINYNLKLAPENIDDEFVMHAEVFFLKLFLR